MTDAEQARAYEQGFRRAGLPLFIEGYSPATDIFNRAVPLLMFVFVVELVGAIDLDLGLAANIGASLGALAIGLAAIGIANRARGRPFRSVPRTIDWRELSGFVLIPAILPLFHGQLLGALLIVLFNLLVLALILGVVGFGLISIVRWAAGRLLAQLASSLGLITKAVPLLMIFSVVLFLTTEVWQVFTEANDVSLAILFCLFAGLGITFLVARLPKEVRALEREAGSEGPELHTRQRVNVGLVLFVSQSLQVLLVSVVVGGFFVAFGLLTVDEQILRGWIGNGGDVLASLELDGRELILTTELLRVSGAIAAFTGLYFAISMLTDDVYRQEFVDELTNEMRESFTERAEYLKLRRSQTASS